MSSRSNPSLAANDASNTGKEYQYSPTGSPTLRNRYDVNSPRKKGNMTMEYPDVPANNNTMSPDDLITSVENPEDADTEKATCGSCFSCFLRPSSKETKLSEMEITATTGADFGAPEAIKFEEHTAPLDSDSETEEDPADGLLPPRDQEDVGKKVLVLDLDETLVHSSFKPVHNADMEIPISIDSVLYTVYVLKRPFVDAFLEEVGKHFEVVIFTASLSMYANPLLDVLDPKRIIKHRLFRESCVLHEGSYVKDLSLLGRRMKDIIFMDNSPLSYAFQPTNAINCSSWFSDKSDTELKDILPVLCKNLKEIKDVRNLLDAYNRSYQWLCDQANVD